MSDDDRLLSSIHNQRVLDDGCTACNHSKVYCRCVAYIDGPQAACCPACDH